MASWVAVEPAQAIPRGQPWFKCLISGAFQAEFGGPAGVIVFDDLELGVA